jgi:hypothetical protein
MSQQRNEVIDLRGPIPADIELHPSVATRKTDPATGLPTRGTSRPVQVRPHAAPPPPVHKVLGEPEPPPPAPPAPPPPPVLATALFPYGNTPEHRPSRVSAEALSFFVAARGTDAEVETVEGLAEAVNRIYADLSALSADYGPGYERARVEVERLSAWYDIWRDRLIAIRKLLSIEAEPPAGVPIPRLLRHVAQGYPDIRPIIVGKLAETREKLAGVAGHLESIKALCGDTERYLSAFTNPPDEWSVRGVLRGPQDWVTDAIDGMFRSRGELTEEIDLLEGDRAHATALMADAVADAVASAGGKQKVADAGWAAMVHERKAEVAPLRALVDALEAEVKEGADIGLDSTPTHVDACARLKGAKERFDAALAAQHRDCRKRADEVLASALAGEAEGRTELERLARLRSQDFAAGFAEAVAGCRLDRLILGEMKAAIDGMKAAIGKGVES